MLCGGVLAAGLFYGGLRVHAAGQQPAAGLYTTAQATRGAAAYKAQKCGECHGDDLAGVDASPALNDANFLEDYTGKSIIVLFEKVQKGMPPTNPGSLTPAQASDLLAYLLSANKYVAGDAELSSDRAQLKAIQLPKPAK